MSPEFTAGRVLVVDDNPVNREVALHLLRQLDCEVIAVADGWAALAAGRERGFDLILMDCEMPGMDGFETTRRLRAEAGSAQCTILALTAFADAAQEALCREAGMDGLLAKPLHLAELRSALASRPGMHGIRSGGETDGTRADQIDAVREVFGPDFPELARLYLHDAQPRMAALHRTHEERSGAQLTQLAHQLAGSSISIGATRLGECCRQLESLVRAAAWNEAGKLLPTMEAELRRVCGKLQALLDAHQP